MILRAISYGVDARIIGHVKKTETTRLSIECEHGAFIYYKI